MLRDMIGAEHIDQLVEAAPELLLVIGDVGQAIGRLATRLHEHPILVQPQGFTPQPDRTVPINREVALPQSPARQLDAAAAVQRVFVEIGIEMYSEASQGTSMSLKIARSAASLNLPVAGSSRRPAAFADQRSGDVTNVLAPVSLLREHNGVADCSR